MGVVLLQCLQEMHTNQKMQHRVLYDTGCGDNTVSSCAFKSNMDRLPTESSASKVLTGNIHLYTH